MSRIAGNVNHVSFPIRDLDRSLAFYRDLLGLEIAPRPDLAVQGAWLEAGNTQIHLIVVPPGTAVDEPPPTLTPIASHVAFTVANHAATLRELKRAGLEVLDTGPERGQMWVQDPDGHVIELIAENARL